ncbi:polysaccharide lyase family 7 protein [Jannaschia sp.]|nr:polysaccharide lyase family 7 protein [Jannaschia sp.]
MRKLLGTVAGAGLLCAFGTQAYAQGCTDDAPLTIVSAVDDGLYDDAYGPHNSIDGSTDPESRWSNESQGTAKSLLLDLGAEQTVRALQIAWYKGDSRRSEFTVQASTDGETFATLIPTRESDGGTNDFETYPVDPTQAKFLRIDGTGNEANDWNSLTEVVVSGCGTQVAAPADPILTPKAGQGMFGLATDKTPGENFDLLGWYVTTPADDDGNEISDSVYENELAAGWTDPRFFYTDPATGGMVFRTTPAGAKTSANTSYTRTELRGMLRRGDMSVETRIEGGFPNKNNWVFSSAPASAQAAAAGVDGKLTATLAVNQVTRQGSDYQVGRVIIGQIHAKDDEPIRLYYRKLPQNKYGSIYYAHEPATGKEQWIEIIGSRADRAANPDDGIALDETFTYEIEVTGEPEGDAIIPMLHVKIIRDDGTEIVAEPLDMRDSGFSIENEFMFFKAGAYTGNNTSPEPETDFDRVIFYALEATHDPAPEMSEGGALLPAAAPAAPEPAQAGTVFADSFADGGRDDGADEADNNWWTTTTSSAIEVAPGSLGLVSGSSGRGIRTTFPPQALTEGQTLQASFTFTTPDFIGEDRDSAFRVGLYDTLGRSNLEGDLSASSKSPNTAYDGLPGWMIDFDIGLTDATAANIDIRRHDDDTQGRLLGTTKGYTRLGGGGEPYAFAPNETYTGTIAITVLSEGIEIAGSLSQDGTELSRFAVTDPEADLDALGMLAFHVNSKTFGTSKTPGEADNGLDFTNVTLEVLEQ